MLFSGPTQVGFPQGGASTQYPQGGAGAQGYDQIFFYVNSTFIRANPYFFTSFRSIITTNSRRFRLLTTISNAINWNRWSLWQRANIPNAWIYWTNWLSKWLSNVNEFFN